MKRVWLNCEEMASTSWGAQLLKATDPHCPPGDVVLTEWVEPRPGKKERQRIRAVFLCGLPPRYEGVRMRPYGYRTLPDEIMFTSMGWSQVAVQALPRTVTVHIYGTWDPVRQVLQVDPPHGSRSLSVS